MVGRDKTERRVKLISQSRKEQLNFNCDCANTAGQQSMLLFIDRYWNDGEPNNQYNEDCAAVYPKTNPFKSWNDAPCNYNLKWICEMQPRSVGMM